jgi:hypothetical protein
MRQLMRPFSLILVLAVAAASQRKQASDHASQGALSVCDILAEPLRYNHQVVTIRGVSVGTGEGWWIEADKTCGTPLKTYGNTWPSTIWVQWIGERPPRPDVGFFSEDSAVKRIDKQARRMHFDPKLDRILLNLPASSRRGSLRPKRSEPHAPTDLDT